MPKSEASL